MKTLMGNKIILGVTGSIASYKSAFLTRLLVKAGCEVRIVMTDAAKAFITPLTLSTLSKNAVLSDLMDGDSWNNHVELGLWADAMLIAPATANTLSKMASGQADNLLVAVYLSAKCPVFFAPAMDLDMWHHPSTQNNINQLEKYGNTLIDVNFGELASGLSGEGRMAEPEEIIEILDDHFSKKKDLEGKVILVTAGPTYEDLDPVRFLGNRSTGKMGLRIAEVLSDRGALVHLVQGPGSEHPQTKIENHIRVRSAEQMYEACNHLFPKCDAAIMAAAVADYKPSATANHKIKKADSDLQLSLQRTQDIAAALGNQKRDDQVLVGFALETQNGKSNALSKLRRKNFDFIVLNSLADKGAGFSGDTNKILILDKSGEEKHFELKSKKKVAEDIIDHLLPMF